MDTTSQESTLSASRKGHRRARTSVNGPSALPSFTFGGTSTATNISPVEPDTAVEDTTQRETLSAPAPARRHRRAVSEFVGEKPAPLQPSNASDLNIQTPSLGLPTRKVHRHRRSGAVDSQDLALLDLPQVLRPQPISTSSDLTPPSSQPPSTEVSPVEDDVTSANRTVAFSDDVSIIQPRPSSMVSSESSGSQSTIRESKTLRNDESPSRSQDQALPHAAVPSMSSMAASYANETGTGVNIVELDENFDHDPTAAVTTLSDYETQHTEHNYIPTTSQSDSSSSPSKEEFDSTITDIDLDLASVDPTPSPSRSSVRALGFEKARLSMHSASPVPGFRNTYQHRRTESAPSLTPVPSSLRSHTNAAEAGFGMSDVFEEDEELEAETFVPASGSTSSRPEEARQSVVSVISNCDTTPKALVGQRAIHSSPNLLPPIQFDLSQSNTMSSVSEPVSQLPVPRPSFAFNDERSPSSRSSPGYAHSGVSSCDARSPSFHHSVDDVPSLISSGSTIGSNTHTNLAQLSPHLDPGIAVARSTSSLAPSSTTRSSRTHRKRLSVMSMSVSKLFTTTIPKEDSNVQEQASRSNSTAAQQPPKTSRARRLTQMLKFWR